MVIKDDLFKGEEELDDKKEPLEQSFNEINFNIFKRMILDNDLDKPFKIGKTTTQIIIDEDEKSFATFTEGRPVHHVCTNMNKMVLHYQYWQKFMPKQAIWSAITSAGVEIWESEYVH